MRDHSSAAISQIYKRDVPVDHHIHRYHIHYQYYIYIMIVEEVRVMVSSDDG